MKALLFQRLSLKPIPLLSFLSSDRGTVSLIQQEGPLVARYLESPSTSLQLPVGFSCLPFALASGSCFPRGVTMTAPSGVQLHPEKRFTQARLPALPDFS